MQPVLGEEAVWGGLAHTSFSFSLTTLETLLPWKANISPSQRQNGMDLTGGQIKIRSLPVLSHWIPLSPGFCHLARDGLPERGKARKCVRGGTKIPLADGITFQQERSVPASHQPEGSWRICPTPGRIAWKTAPHRFSYTVSGDLEDCTSHARLTCRFTAHRF